MRINKSGKKTSKHSNYTYSYGFRFTILYGTCVAKFFFPHCCLLSFVNDNYYLHLYNAFIVGNSKHSGMASPPTIVGEAIKLRFYILYVLQITINFSVHLL